MPVMPLIGDALAGAIDLARAVVDGHDVLFYRCTLKRGELDETTIPDISWLPSGPTWVDATGEVLLSASAEVAHDEIGTEITFTVADESRLVWADDLAVAVVARHWFPSSFAYGNWHLAGWGYLDGSDRQTLRLGLDQTGQRRATYAGYWGKSRVDAVRLGRRNLATSATIVAASPALFDVQSESPIEYVSADNVNPPKVLDGKADTPSIADVIADPAVPTLGDTSVPRFLRAYGPFTPGVAAGGEPRFVELWCGHLVTPWGTTWSGIPGMYQEGTPAVRDEPGHLKTEVVTYPDGAKGFRVTTYANASPTANTWIQWIVGGNVGVPMRVSLEIKAASTFSIGKTIHSLSIGDASQQHTQRQETQLALSQEWQKYEFVFEADQHSPGAKVEITTGLGESRGGDLLYELRNLRVEEGYSDNTHAIANSSKRLFLCGDNGMGGQFCQRIEFDLTANQEEWKIPAFGSIVIADDIPTFKRRFGDTGKTVLQLKGRQPGWFFAPGVGRMKLAYATDPNRTNYNDPSLELVEEANFTTFGYTAQQAVRKGTGAVGDPIGTGAWTTEDFPHVGLLPTGGYGAAYWWLDLGAYQAPKLRQALTTTSTRVPVDDIDAYTDSGLGTIDAERFWWIGKDGDSLLVHQRAISGTTAAAHDAGASVVPDAYSGTYQNVGLPQRGWNVDQISIRRKPSRDDGRGGRIPPAILAGAVLVSNQVAPGDPSTGGARWERHPDWHLIQRFSAREGNWDIITVDIAKLIGGPFEMRHVVFVVDQMGRANGIPQRAKVNEIQVFEAQLSAGTAGRFAGKNASDLGGALGWLLVNKAGMPASKVRIAPKRGSDDDGSLLNAIDTPPIGDLPIAPTTAAQAIQALAASGFLRVWLDAANNATIDAAPTNANYTPTQPYFVLDESNLTGDISLTWSAAHQTAQVQVSAREAASLRTYSASYPGSRAASLGDVAQIRDVLIRTSSDVYATAEAEFRARNARRQLAVTMGAVPWCEVGQRWLLSSSAIDLGGQGQGVNFAVASYRIAIGVDEGGISWQSSISLQELAL